MNKSSQTLIFAHRGANKEAPENTRSAFETALQYSIDGIETDVQLSRDEIAVLWHDRFLGKLGMPLKHIDDFDYAQLREMNFAAQFSPEAVPEGIMSLKAFLDAYRNRSRLLIEIKNRTWESRARQEAKTRQTLDMIGEAQDDRILVSSFNLDSIVFAHRHAPQFPLVLNLEAEHGVGFARKVLAGHGFLHGLCVHIDTLHDDMVGAVREAGKRIAVYTCNTDEEIGRALALGVDILISDVPQKALQMRGR